MVIEMIDYNHSIIQLGGWKGVNESTQINAHFL